MPGSASRSQVCRSPRPRRAGRPPSTGAVASRAHRGASGRPRVSRTSTYSARNPAASSVATSAPEKIHGSRRAPRPTITRAQPVSRRMRSRSPWSHALPFPATGIETACTARAIRDQKTSSWYPSRRVRQWMVSIEAPPASAARARTSTSRSWSKPARILAVTGTRPSTPATAARTVASIPRGSLSAAAPAQPLSAPRAGQPKLMSTTGTPSSAALAAEPVRPCR